MIPLNVPFFWKVVLNTPTSESGFINGANISINSLIQDLNAYYSAIKLDTAGRNLLKAIRIITVNHTDEATEDEMEYLKTQNFLYQSNNLFPGSEAVIVDTLSAAQHLTDNPADEASLLTVDTDFFIKENNIVFYSAIDKTTWIDTTYTFSSGKTIKVKQKHFFLLNYAENKSVIFEAFGSLVGLEDISDLETELFYRTKVASLLNIKYNGATLSALQSFFSVFNGIPVILHNEETVLSITSNKLVTDKDTYNLSPALGPVSVVIGKTYDYLTPLYEEVKVFENIPETYADGKLLPEAYYKTTLPEQKVLNLVETHKVSELDSYPNFFNFDIFNLKYEEDEGEQGVHSTTKYLWDSILNKALYLIVTKRPDYITSDFIDNELADILPLWASPLYISEISVTETVPTTGELVYQVKPVSSNAFGARNSFSGLRLRDTTSGVDFDFTECSYCIIELVTALDEMHDFILYSEEVTIDVTVEKIPGKTTDTVSIQLS